MSIEREFRRFANRKRMKEERKRTTCRHCKNKLLEKPGYGLVCPECGWMKQESAGGEDNAAD